MRSEIRHMGDLPVLSFAGELDFAACPSVDSAIEAAAAEGDGHLIIDLDEVAYMDSPIFGCLIKAHHRLGANHLAIVCPQPELMKLVKATMLDTELCFVNDVQEARDCFM